MTELPKIKVGIVSCSGEEIPEGTISRIATRKVLDKLRPGNTSTICLPLFLAGEKAERDFARVYPTITIDGCNKLCAKKATEKLSGKVTASINVKDFIHYGEVLANRRNLDEVELKVVDRVAQAVAEKVDEIIKKKREDISLALGDEEEEKGTTVAEVGCECNVPEASYVDLNIDGERARLRYLKEIFEYVSCDEAEGKEEVGERIFDLVKAYNSIPPEKEELYKEAVLKEFSSYKGGLR